jgi:hypothetical protein
MKTASTIIDLAANASLRIRSVELIGSEGEKAELEFKTAPKETEMRKRVLSVLGVLVVSALTAQVAAAAPHSSGKAARASARLNRQFRDVFNSASKPVDTKSCDIIWCYPD